METQSTPRGVERPLNNIPVIRNYKKAQYHSGTSKFKLALSSALYNNYVLKATCSVICFFIIKHMEIQKY